MKTISSGSTWTQKDCSWFVLKPAARLDTNPISGQFCNSEHAPKPGRPAHADAPWTVWDCADRLWRMDAEIPETLCGIHAPPRTLCGDSSEPPIKQGGGEGGGDVGVTCERNDGWKMQCCPLWLTQGYQSHKAPTEAVAGSQSRGVSSWCHLWILTSFNHHLILIKSDLMLPTVSP